MSTLSNPINEDAVDILSQYKIFYYRDLEGPEAKENKSINIMHAGDTLRADQKTFDGSPRIESYVLVIICPGLQYIDAQKAMRDCVQAAKLELETNPDFATWAEFMELGDVRPAYDDRGIFKEVQMQLLFYVDEDYTLDDEDKVSRIQVRGELDG